MFNRADFISSVIYNGETADFISSVIYNGETADFISSVIYNGETADFISSVIYNGETAVTYRREGNLVGDPPNDVINCKKCYAKEKMHTN